MATILLGAAGSALGGAIGGTILGASAATIGGAIGTFVGSAVDSLIVSALAPPQRIEGARLDDIRITSATEGAVIPRLYGTMRLGGNIIWATEFREETIRTRQGGAGKGGGPRVVTTEYRYFASFAVALCEGPIGGVGRIWADGKPFDVPGAVWRVYRGTEDQLPDPFIEAKEGAGQTPAYRGTAYVVFEELPLAGFGNRLPQLSFEVIRPPIDAASMEQLIGAVNLIPSAGEFVYATETVVRAPAPPGGWAGLPGDTQPDTGGEAIPENANNAENRPDLLASLDRLDAALPNCAAVNLVVSWFGTDLRMGECEIKPGVEFAEKNTSPRVWSVNGVGRAAAHVVSREDGRPAYGGTPADFAVVQAIRELKARGKRVTFYPFILMDVPAGNALPNPYSANASEIGQAVYPWRGRIGLSPAPGFAGSPDKTLAAAAQVAAFFGSATAADFAVAGETVAWTGSAGDWGLRRMILHYAFLCAAAGGVDAFLIGTELRSLTTARDGPSSYPAVAAFVALAADVSAILGAGTKVSYAADWSEYWGHNPNDGTGDFHFHLDPLWASADIDFIGIDNYQPLSDWRDGDGHADALAGWEGVHDLDYLRWNVEGGEGFNWFYASDADRQAQLRLWIADGAYGEPWVFRYKALRDWWGSAHHDRPGGVRNSLIANGGKPDNWTDGGGTPGVSPLPGVWLGRYANAITLTSVGAVNARQVSGWHTVASPGLTFKARFWIGAGTATQVRLMAQRLSPVAIGFVECNPVAGSLGLVNPGPIFSISNQSITPLGGGAFLVEFDVGGLSSGEAIRAAVGFGAGLGTTVAVYGAEIQRAGVSTTPWVPGSKPMRFTEAGTAALDRSTNQPNVFVDPKSSESFLPYFSRGWPDEAMQRRYCEALIGYWSDPANNPAASLYAGRMIEAAETAIWTWDARPFPAFPARTDVWDDAENWRLGHWLTGRAGGSGLAELVRELCGRAGIAPGLIDSRLLVGSVPGFVVTALESPRGSIETLAKLFGFDGVESGGVLRFVPRGRRPAASIGAAALVAPNRDADDLVLTRAQETELPRALKWRLMARDEEFAGITVEARRFTADSVRTVAEELPIAATTGAAERGVRRALFEQWVGRETAAFGLPPSRIALDPADAILLEHDGRNLELTIQSATDGDFRRIEARRSDRALAELAPGPERRPSSVLPTVYGQPLVALMNLPRLAEAFPDWQPYVAVHAVPWIGEAAVWRSPGEDGFEALTLVGTPALVGTLAFDFYPGPPNRWDSGNELWVDMLSGAFASVPDAEALRGANTIAVESSPGVWEIVGFAIASLQSAGRWRLTRLLRGLLGTEDAMGVPAPAGSRIVVLDAGVKPVPIQAGEFGSPWNWRIGPAARPASDPAARALAFAPNGRGLRTLSPCQLRRAVLPGGDLRLSWVRRTRDFAVDNWALAEAPLGEGAEAYDLEILDGTAVVRAAAGLAQPSFVYTAGMQAADFGAPQAAVRFRVFQIGALGRGPGAEAQP